MVAPESSTIAGPSNAMPGSSFVAVVDRGLPGRLRARNRPSRRPLSAASALAPPPSRFGHRQLADFRRGDEMDADHLDRRIEAIGVFALVGLVEGRLDRREPVARRRRRLRSAPRSCVPGSGSGTCRSADPDLSARRLRRRTGRARSASVSPKAVFDALGRARPQIGEPRHEIVAAQVRHHHAPGRKHRGGRGHDDLFDAEFGGERDGVHAAAAAERDEREIARIVAAIQRHELQRIDHVVVGDADDSARRLVRVDAELLADAPRSPPQPPPCRRRSRRRRNNPC